MIRIPVPLDKSVDPKDGWSRARLHRLKDTLRELVSYRLSSIERDKYGNIFVWRGKHPRRGVVLVWYLPELDELRILLHPPSQKVEGEILSG
jgi:hypothetical protein